MIFIYIAFTAVLFCKYFHNSNSSITVCFAAADDDDDNVSGGKLTYCGPRMVPIPLLPDG